MTLEEAAQRLLAVRLVDCPDDIQNEEDVVALVNMPGGLRAQFLPVFELDRADVLGFALSCSHLRIKTLDDLPGRLTPGAVSSALGIDRDTVDALLAKGALNWCGPVDYVVTVEDASVLDYLSRYEDKLMSIEEASELLGSDVRELVFSKEIEPHYVAVKTPSDVINSYRNSSRPWVPHIGEAAPVAMFWRSEIRRYEEQNP